MFYNITLYLIDQELSSNGQNTIYSVTSVPSGNGYYLKTYYNVTYIYPGGDGSLILGFVLSNGAKIYVSIYPNSSSYLQNTLILSVYNSTGNNIINESWNVGIVSTNEEYEVELIYYSNTQTLYWWFNGYSGNYSINIQQNQFSYPVDGILYGINGGNITFYDIVARNLQEPLYYIGPFCQTPIEFDKAGTFIWYNQSPIITDTNFTVAMWINRQFMQQISIPGAGADNVFFRATNNTQYAEIKCGGSYFGPSLYCSLFNGSTGIMITANISLDEWYFLVLEANGTALCLYLNASLVNCTSLPPDTIPRELSSYLIGDFGAPSDVDNIIGFYGFGGYIADVQLYNYPLSQQQILDLYLYGG